MTAGNQPSSSGGESAFDICEMIVSEEFHLDEENPPLPAIQSYGYAARDRIRAAKRAVCGGAQAERPYCDPVEQGKAFYLAMYEKKGAIWNANEHQELWVDLARDYERRRREVSSVPSTTRETPTNIGAYIDDNTEDQ